MVLKGVTPDRVTMLQGMTSHQSTSGHTNDSIGLSIYERIYEIQWAGYEGEGRLGRGLI